ncbi:hypothetical protein [Fluviispira vulneris]|uniref:hypothetical protein n=1 Tax=Fluviispira vulneris TaxID=2763012 RepID=UPI00164548BE|nr:hypothetical protein [Fluviispira vulneris]
MTTLATKNESEALQILMSNLDDSKFITDEFLAEFAGVRKDNFNCKAEQLKKCGILDNFYKITIDNFNNIGIVNQKIIIKYKLSDVILILSQYENSHQRRALKLCKRALDMFVDDAIMNYENFIESNLMHIQKTLSGLQEKHSKFSNELIQIKNSKLNKNSQEKLIHIQKTIAGLKKKHTKFSDELMQIKNSKLNKIRP